MNTHADNAQGGQSQAAVNTSVQLTARSESPFERIDQRPQAIAQRKLQELADNSSQARQLSSLRKLSNNSHRTQKLAQLRTLATQHSSSLRSIVQRKANNTGLPDQLKSGIESLSGYSMDDVKVHYNSDRPAQLQAHAYAQGTDIHLAPGQERHLPHEAWHVVQQKQGRVKPTLQLRAKVYVNDDEDLEREADVMGARALQTRSAGKSLREQAIRLPLLQKNGLPAIIQRKTSITHTYSYITPDIGDRRTNYKVGRKVVALLDPNDPIKGSATGAHWDWMGPMREKYGKLVKGHLLNHDLGGFAMEENLYPITSAANQEHSSQVEQEVKRILFEDAPRVGRRLQYEVKVNEKVRHDPRNVEFKCWWGWEKKGRIGWATKLGSYNVRSQMQKGSNYGGFRGSPKNKFPMKGGNPYADAWYHGSRAEENPAVNHDWAQHQSGWLTASNTIGVWGSWDTYRRDPRKAIPIKNADKTKVNRVPSMITQNRVAIENISKFMHWFHETLGHQGFDKVFAKVFYDYIQNALIDALETGEGKARRISSFISRKGIGTLGNKLDNILRGISADLIKIIGDVEVQLQDRWNKKDWRTKPGSAFYKTKWDQQDWLIIANAKSEIYDLIEITIDQEKWD